MSKPEKAADIIRKAGCGKQFDRLTKSVMEAPSGRVRRMVVDRNAKRMRDGR